MTEHDEFVQEIRAAPRDITPRLIYADYLEESGDPRGEFIRIQCELSELPTGDAARLPLKERELELLGKFADRWLQPLRELGAIGVSRRCFQRGLIERVTMTAESFAQNGEELCRIAPAVCGVELRRPEDRGDELRTAVVPPQLTELDLSSNQLTADDLESWISEAWWQQVTRLHLAFSNLADEGVSALTRFACPRLESLNLAANQIGPAGSESLAHWEGLVGVRTLELNFNRLGDEGVRQLADSPFAKALRTLDLSSNGIGSAGARAIAASRSLAELERLLLRANRIDAGGFLALQNATGLQTLRLLDVRSNAAAGANLRERFGDAVIV